ncbi:E3 ubiquitin-protein ligase TRIM21-like [Pagrus major]|uniref:E3 ubiquitin-protein ligase TRIM21-like n=1 Tax=Pagrus major TaxID=143350 RepID=UPI003CC84F43
MSAATCRLSQEDFLCSICLDVFSAPVTLLCGHNFCKNCITVNWRINRKIQCPVCKKRFDTSHELHVNTFISEMAAQFRESAAKNTSEEAKPGEVPCDACAEIKLKALKSCLVCLASYCDTHLKRHQTVPGLKRHKLVEPLDNIEDRTCTKHDEIMELFCKTDQMCVCRFCMESDHESHDVVSLMEECTGKRTELGKTEAEFQQMIQERQQKIEELRQSAKLSKDAADKAVADGVEVFTGLTQLVQTGLTDLTEQIKNKHKTTEKQAKDFIKELDQEISELLKRTAEVKLLGSKGHFHFLQSFLSLNASLPVKDWAKVSIRQPSYEGTVAGAVSQIKETLNKEIEKQLEAELKRVQQFAVDVTLDPDTAHPKLILSENGKQVDHGDVEQNLPENAERFLYCVIVLAKQSFSSGRFYYEVEVKGKTKWDLGVVSASATRKGQIISSPEAGYWTLQLRNGNEYVALADPDVLLSVKSRPQKVGVFVDYEEDLVSFYNADTADIIYSFTACSFTGKLHPFFSPCVNDGGENSAPLRISVVHRTD